MKLALLLLCSCVFAIGQSAPLVPEKSRNAPLASCDQKPQNPDVQDIPVPRDTDPPRRDTGGLDILSDTRGVDFGPYLQRMVQRVRENWYRLIPASKQMKKGKLAIEFAIRKDGSIADMRLVARSGDVELDRPAWGSITMSNPFPALPDEFTGPYLALRLRFYYNPEYSDLNPTPQKSQKSGVTISISAPGQLEEVPLGTTKPVAVVLTGNQPVGNSVEWTLSGVGCSGAACGEITKDSYVAPKVMPDPPCVTLTAISKADPTAKASVTVHIVPNVQPASPH